MFRGVLVVFQDSDQGFGSLRIVSQVLESCKIGAEIIGSLKGSCKASKRVR